MFEEEEIRRMKMEERKMMGMTDEDIDKCDREQKMRAYIKSGTHTNSIVFIIELRRTQRPILVLVKATSKIIQSFQGLSYPRQSHFRKAMIG